MGLTLFIINKMNFYKLILYICKYLKYIKIYIKKYIKKFIMVISTAKKLKYPLYIFFPLTGKF